MLDEQIREAIQEYQFSQKRIAELTSFINDLKDENKVLRTLKKSKKNTDNYIHNLVMIKESESLIKFLKLRMDLRKPVLVGMV